MLFRIIGDLAWTLNRLKIYKFIYKSLYYKLFIKSLKAAPEDFH